MEGSWTDDGEAQKEDIRFRVTKRPKSIKVILIEEIKQELIGGQSRTHRHRRKVVSLRARTNRLAYLAGCITELQTNWLIINRNDDEIIIEGRGHVFRRVPIRCVGYDHGSLSNGAVPNEHTFDRLFTSRHE